MSIAVETDRQPGEEPEATIDGLMALTAADMERVNRTIVERMQSPVRLIPQLAGHIVAAGGKRLRPMLTIAAAKLFGFEGARHVGLAACVEFIHTATLLHDDVVDESDLRRGAATANAVWGNKAPVLVGDFLFARAFELMVEDGSLEVLRILSEASSVIAEGEVLQLATANDTATTEEAYLEVIDAKTAKLFAAACEIGAVVGERSEAERAGMVAFGRNLGMAFQLVDDALDYSAERATLGKNIGDDFREGKITLPIVLALRTAGAEEHGFWRRALEELDQRDGDLQRAIALLRKTGALAATLERARAYGRRAAQALAPMPEGEPKDALAEAVTFAITRRR